MKISKTAIITFLTVLLFLGILFFIVYGCMSFAGVEHFETKEAETETGSSKKESKKSDKEDNKDHKEDKHEKADKTDDVSSSDLTKKERELFEDLKNNKLSTEQITDLVKGGVLTEKLVEKFLSNLKTTSTEEEHTPDHVEGFVVGGSTFASY